MFVGPSYRTVATRQTGAFVGYDVRRDSFSGGRRMVGTPRETRAQETRAAVYTRTYPETKGSSMTHSTRVALRGSRGASTMPFIKLFSGAPHKLFAGFNGDHHQAV